MNWKMTPPDWPAIDAFLLANGWAIIGLLLLLAGAGLLLDYLRRSWSARRRRAHRLDPFPHSLQVKEWPPPPPDPNQDDSQGWP